MAPPQDKDKTDKLLQQILDVAKQNLEVSKQALEVSQQSLSAEESAAASLETMLSLLQGFTHNYSIQVEQILVTKPKTNPKK